MMSSKKPKESVTENCLSLEEQQAKINEVRKMIGSVKAQKLPEMCSDASISRYLRARNWNASKASKMLLQTIKWRLEYRPDNIRWEDIAIEAETGKIYRADYYDKFGRPVIVMRPGYQNTKCVGNQIKFLVYCMENAISDLGPDQEQVVWLIDFNKWTSSSTSLKSTRETTHILQNHYPERLGLGILYDPPKMFESFWKIVKPFIESKTYKKVNFAYSNNPQSRKIMEETFDMNTLECAFGGKNSDGFNYTAYAQRMKEDDKKFPSTSVEADQIVESLPFEQGDDDDDDDEGDHSSSSDDNTSSSRIILDDINSGVESVEEIQTKPMS